MDVTIFFSEDGGPGVTLHTGGRYWPCTINRDMNKTNVDAEMCLKASDDDGWMWMEVKVMNFGGPMGVRHFKAKEVKFTRGARRVHFYGHFYDPQPAVVEAPAPPPGGGEQVQATGAGCGAGAAEANSTNPPTSKKARTS